MQCTGPGIICFVVVAHRRVSNSHANSQLLNHCRRAHSTSQCSGCSRTCSGSGMNPCDLSWRQPQMKTGGKRARTWATQIEARICKSMHTSVCIYVCMPCACGWGYGQQWSMAGAQGRSEVEHCQSHTARPHSPHV